MHTLSDSRLLLGAALLGAIAGLTAPTSCAAEPFRGVYVGGDFGYDSSDRTRADGLGYGGFVGINVGLSDRLFAGAEARLGDSTISERRRVETPSSITVSSASVGRSIGVSGRIGWLAGPRTGLFLRAGWEDTRLNAVQTRTPKPPTSNPNPVIQDFGFNQGSAVLGGGVEHYVTRKVSLRATYDWSERFDRHQLRLGAAFSF